MSQQTIISLVRHGHIVNPHDVFHGRLPKFPLSELGRHQVEAAGEALQGTAVRAIYTSPMLRARQSGSILYRILQPSVPLRISRRLNEIYSPFDGHSHVDMAARDWDFYTDVSVPYEQPADILRRMQQFFQHVRRQFPGEHVVAVSHADPIAFTLLWALGQAIMPENRTRLEEFGLMDPYPATASISMLRFGGEPEEVVPQVQYIRPYLLVE